MVSWVDTRTRLQRDWQPYYDELSNSIVLKNCSWEIEHFGYTFEDEPTAQPGLIRY